MERFLVESTFNFLPALQWETARLMDVVYALKVHCEDLLLKNTGHMSFKHKVAIQRLLELPKDKINLIRSVEIPI